MKADIYIKLSNFGHHNEFDDSGITVKTYRINYDHQADKNKRQYGANYNLKIVNDNFLPKFLITNREKYKDWFDNLDD